MAVHHSENTWIHWFRLALKGKITQRNYNRLKWLTLNPKYNSFNHSNQNQSADPPDECTLTPAMRERRLQALEKERMKEAENEERKLKAVKLTKEEEELIEEEAWRRARTLKEDYVKEMPRLVSLDSVRALDLCEDVWRDKVEKALKSIKAGETRKAFKEQLDRENARNAKANYENKENLLKAGRSRKERRSKRSEESSRERTDLFSKEVDEIKVEDVDRRKESSSSKNCCGKSVPKSELGRGEGPYEKTNSKAIDSSEKKYSRKTTNTASHEMLSLDSGKNDGKSNDALLNSEKQKKAADGIEETQKKDKGAVKKHVNKSRASRKKKPCCCCVYLSFFSLYFQNNFMRKKTKSEGARVPAKGDPRQGTGRIDS